MYKNIRIKMKSGKTRTQRVQVLKSGKYKFVKNLGTTVKRKISRKSNPKKTRSVKRTAKKKRRRRSRSMTIPIAAVGGGLAGAIEPIINCGIKQGDWLNAARWTIAHYTGYDMIDGVFRAEELMKGLAPAVAGLLVHKFVGGSPLNLNKTLANANVPFIRI